MTNQNQNTEKMEKMEIDKKINFPAFDGSSSSIDDQYSPITATSGWDQPLPSNPPASWGLKSPKERVIVKMEKHPSILIPAFVVLTSK